MAGKVTPLFTRSSVQNALCEASDLGLTEIVMIGKKQSGGYWVRLSPCEKAYEYLGMIDRLKHELHLALDEETA